MAVKVLKGLWCFYGERLRELGLLSTDKGMQRSIVPYLQIRISLPHFSLRRSLSPAPPDLYPWLMQQKKKKDGQAHRTDVSTEEFQRAACVSGLSLHVSIQSGTACTQQIQPYAHTQLHIAPYSCRSEECTERIYSTSLLPPPSPAHNLRGWEGT